MSSGVKTVKDQRAILGHALADQLKHLELFVESFILKRLRAQLVPVFYSPDRAVEQAMADGRIIGWIDLETEGFNMIAGP